MNHKKHYFYNVLTLLKYVWKFAPEIFFYQCVMIVGRILVNVLVYVSMIKYVVDAIAEHRSFGEVAAYILFVGAIQLVVDFINNFFGHYIYKIAKLKIHKGVHGIIFQKIQGVDLENYDNVEFYNDYIWALEKADTEIVKSYENLFKFIEYAGNAAALFSVTLVYDKLLLLFVVVPLIFNVVLGNYISRLDYEMEGEVNVIQRRKNYFRRVFYLKDYAKELKLYSIAKLLREKFDESVEGQLGIYKKYGFRFVWTHTVNDNLTSVFDYVLLCLYMAYRAIVQGAYTAGTCAAMLNAVGNMSYALEEVFGLFPMIKKNGMFAEKILRIMHYESDIEGAVNPDTHVTDFKKLELRDVSFAYPGTQHPCLQDINLDILNGEKIAIVGMNGAGKTTLIKVIMRYYDVTEGSVLYNGTDIRTFTTDDYRQRFSTIFQDFQVYAVRLDENIRMDFVEEEEKEAVRKALRDSSLSEYTDALSANITKEFDENGLVLSGGQKQKLAIARALFGDADIVIMDEASSALDPISEARVNETIMRQMKDKSMLIISHRLSTIKHVDKICLMEHGRIAEMGTHEQLMKLNGKYAEMYMVQASQYCEG